MSVLKENGNSTIRFDCNFTIYIDLLNGTHQVRNEDKSREKGSPGRHHHVWRSGVEQNVLSMNFVLIYTKKILKILSCLRFLKWQKNQEQYYSEFQGFRS